MLEIRNKLNENQEKINFIHVVEVNALVLENLYMHDHEDDVAIVG